MRHLLSAGRVSAAASNGHAAEPPHAVGLSATAVPADNPYLRGRAEFDSVFGDLARGKRNWQLAAFGTLALSGVLAGGLVTLALQSRVTPYVVEVDKLGQAQAFGPAEPLREPDRRVIVSQLAGFVRDIRTVLADPVAQGELVRHAFAFVDENADAFLNDYFASPAQDPRRLGKEFTRIVEVTGVLPVPRSSTWKVSWTETVLPRTTGALPTVTAWEGYFGARIVPPTTTERITANPLGLYVTSINWTQLAEQPAAPRSGGAAPAATGAAPTTPAAGVLP